MHVTGLCCIVKAAVFFIADIQLLKKNVRIKMLFSFAFWVFLCGGIKFAQCVLWPCHLLYHILHLYTVIMLLLFVPEVQPKCHIQVVSTAVLYSEGSRFNSQSVNLMYVCSCIVV
jgi:hypothetical protein